jgi:hypothetical protein
MKEYNETAVIVDKKVWKEMNERLALLEKQGKTLSVEIVYNVAADHGSWPYYTTVGNFIIKNSDKISPDCIEEFNEKIQLIYESYSKYNNLYLESLISNAEKNELTNIKKSWLYKLFLKNRKL